jgi:hypothetical protein
MRLVSRALFVVLVLALLAPSRARARIYIVQPGDRITVLPGVYREGAAADPSALTVTRDGIALVGLSSPGHPVVLQNAGDQWYGLWVSPADSAKPPVAGPRPPCSSSGATLRGHCQLIENRDQAPFPQGNLRVCEGYKYKGA